MTNTNTNTAYNQNGIAAEKFVEDLTSSAHQEYQKNGVEAARLFD